MGDVKSVANNGGVTGKGFVKGQSGNPSGKAKTPPEIKEAFTKLVPKAIETLTSILVDPEAKQSDRMKAAEVILDRALGKAVQQNDISVTDVRPIVFPEGLLIETKPKTS
jgi:hypothetical protein